MKIFSLILVFNSRKLGNEGFTLIEILIAITILAFVTLGVVSVTENAAQTMERTTELNRNNLQIETALSRFEWDFAQIYSPLYFTTVMNLNQMGTQGGAAGVDGGGIDGTTGTNNGGIGQTDPRVQNYLESLSTRFDRNEHFRAVSKEGLPIPRFYNPEKNVFEFFTSANRRKTENTKQSHFAWVRYSLVEPDQKDDGEKNPNIPNSLKNLVRYFNPDNPYDEKRIDPTNAEIKGAVLLENVESLEFHFWDYNRRKWETSLRSVAGGESLIRGVKIIVSWYDSTGNKRTLSRVFRNHWPMVAPKDQIQGAGRAGRTATGAAAGATVGVNSGGNDGEDQDSE